MSYETSHVTQKVSPNRVSRFLIHTILYLDIIFFNLSSTLKIFIILFILFLSIQDCNYALHAFVTLRRPRVSYIDWEEDDNFECEEKVDSNDTFECDKKDNPMIVSDDESDCSEDMEVDENLDSENEDDDKICHLQPNLPIPTPKSYYEMFPQHHDLEELIPANDVHDLIKYSLSKKYHEDLLIKKLVPETTRSAMIAYVMKKL